MVCVKWKKLHSDAELPRFNHRGDSGVDIKIVESCTIPPFGRVLLKTGLAVEVPEGYEVQIRPRSGISLKTPLLIANSPGTIDSNYRGEVCIVAFNASDKTYTVSRGTRIAQAVVVKLPEVEHVEADSLSATSRGAGGFGSTGL